MSLFKHRVVVKKRQYRADRSELKQRPKKPRSLIHPEEKRDTTVPSSIL